MVIRNYLRNNLVPGYSLVFRYSMLVCDPGMAAHHGWDNPTGRNNLGSLYRYLLLVWYGLIGLGIMF